MVRRFKVIVEKHPDGYVAYPLGLKGVVVGEGEVALALMVQLKARGHPDAPPAMVSDGKGSYREAMVETWGQVPEYTGQGRPPTRQQAQPGWHYLQVIKHRSGGRLTGSRSRWSTATRKRYGNGRNGRCLRPSVPGKIGCTT